MCLSAYQTFALRLMRVRTSNATGLVRRDVFQHLSAVKWLGVAAVVADCVLEDLGLFGRDRHRVLQDHPQDRLAARWGGQRAGITVGSPVNEEKQPDKIPLLWVGQ